ncbi:hypothetical protein FQN54_004871 [Arachnomyces sp. PD_36]|nr:hypothetical protein FQN54_004871 [Arachnomyces sp. PD_36]
MLKKTSILCCCGGFPLGAFPISSRLPSSPSPIRDNRQRTQTSFRRQCRQYANVRDVDPSESDNDLSWPHTHTYTPYDIFKQGRGDPYSKRRFYELVKIYHPDRPCNNHPQCRHISDAVRLERYRLVVAAHEILSDPIKRDTYDRFGADWHQWNRITGFNHDGTEAVGTQQPYGRGEGFDDSVFKNATWEDWERWYQRHEPRRPQNYDVSQNTFASLVILIAIFAGVGQLSTFGSYSTSVEERLKEINEQCSRFLAGRREQTLSQMNSQDARVQNFLIKRDPSGHGLKEEEEETYRKILGTPDSSNKLADLKETAQKAAKSRPTNAAHDGSRQLVPVNDETKDER